MKKNNNFLGYLAYVVSLILIIILAILINNHFTKEEETLKNISKEIKDTFFVTITDTYRNINKSTTLTVEDDDATKLVNILKTAKEATSTNGSEGRYKITLFDSDKKILKTFTYFPLKMDGYGKELEIDGDIYSILEKYNADISEFEPNLNKDLKKSTKIIVKDWANQEKKLKEITKVKDIEKIANIITNSEVWEGDVNTIGLSYYLEFRNKDELIATLEYGHNAFLKYNNNYYTLNFDSESLDNLLK